MQYAYTTVRASNSGSPGFKPHSVDSPNVGRRALMPQNSLFERKRAEDYQKVGGID